MISRVVASECQRMVPELPSFTFAEQNGKFAPRCVIGFTGGCPNAGPEQWSGHGGGLQIIGCSFFNWEICGPRLAHKASRRCIFGTPCCLRRRRAPGKKCDACSGGGDTNPDRCFCAFRIQAFFPSGVIWRNCFVSCCRDISSSVEARIVAAFHTSAKLDTSYRLSLHLP